MKNGTHVIEKVANAMFFFFFFFWGGGGGGWGQRQRCVQFKATR